MKTKDTLVVFLLTLFMAASWGQEFPSKPVRLIVPFPTGGGSDLLARILAQRLHTKWGQPVIVENRAGAGGNLGAEYVARSEPDGHTLLISSPGPLVINKNLYEKLGFDPDTLVPVSIVARNYAVLVAHPKVGVKDVRQLVALAKAQPDRLNYATPGNGSTPHLATELFKSMAGVKMAHVPYKGSGPAFTDLLGGQVDVMFADVFTALQHIRSGKLHALALGGGKRDPLLPNVPVMAEVIPGFGYMVWQGVVAPAGTPPVVTGNLSSAIAEVLNQPDVAKRLSEVGLEPVGSTPAEMAQVMNADRRRWGTVIRATGAKAD